MDNTMKMKDHALIGALHETTSRYGSAAAESLKGLRGIDNETGQVFDRGLQKETSSSKQDILQKWSVFQNAMPERL